MEKNMKKQQTETLISECQRSRQKSICNLYNLTERFPWTHCISKNKKNKQTRKPKHSAFSASSGNSLPEEKKKKVLCAVLFELFSWWIESAVINWVHNSWEWTVSVSHLMAVLTEAAACLGPGSDYWLTPCLSECNFLCVQPAASFSIQHDYHNFRSLQQCFHSF